MDRVDLRKGHRFNREIKGSFIAKDKTMKLFI